MLNKVQIKIMKAALENTNYLRYRKLDEIKSARKWKQEDVPFPVYKKADILVNSVGWRNLLRSLRP